MSPAKQRPTSWSAVESRSAAQHGDSPPAEMVRPMVPGKRSKRTTIRDVAARAGVSVGAASTALSNRPSNVVLSAETRERIRRAALELNYRPLSAARAMAGARFGRLGVLATEDCLRDSVHSGILHGVATELGRQGYRLLLQVVPERRDMAHSGIFTEQDIDGVIILVDADERTRAALQRYEIPHIWVNTELQEPHNCVHADDTAGTLLAVDHLVRLGHRRIAFVRHVRGERGHLAMQRERGYLAGLERHGLEVVPTHKRYIEVSEHIDLYLRMKSPPTALLVSSDALALQVCAALARRGLRVPEDVSVVGHDGVGLHRCTLPHLTTVAVPVEEMGRTAVWMLLDQLERGQPAASVLLAESLEVNASTAPPPVP